MASPYTEVANALKTIIDAEWSTEGWTALHDNLHPAQGKDGLRIGIAPDEEVGAPGQMNQNNISVTVKFYMRWDPDVDYDKKIDPRIVSEHAFRFRQAIQDYSGPNTSKAWYFNVTRIRYPRDPVGNCTRFEADVVAYGDNPAFVETTG